MDVSKSMSEKIQVLRGLAIIGVVMIHSAPDVGGYRYGLDRF